MFMCHAGNGESLEFHLHLGRLCRLSFDVQMHASHGGSCFLFVSHTVQDARHTANTKVHSEIHRGRR